jgi:hypothetical protein
VRRQQGKGPRRPLRDGARFSRPRVRWTTQRLGSTIKPLTSRLLYLTMITLIRLASSAARWVSSPAYPPSTKANFTQGLIWLKSFRRRQARAILNVGRGDLALDR